MAVAQQRSQVVVLVVAGGVVLQLRGGETRGGRGQGFWRWEDKKTDGVCGRGRGQGAGGRGQQREGLAPARERGAGAWAARGLVVAGGVVLQLWGCDREEAAGATMGLPS